MLRALAALGAKPRRLAVWNSGLVGGAPSSNAAGARQRRWSGTEETVGTRNGRERGKADAGAKIEEQTERQHCGPERGQRRVRRLPR